MNLTAAQLTLLKTHIQANTNVVSQLDGSGTFVANQVGLDASSPSSLAAWYNGTALAGDNQAPANLRVWNPLTTIAQIKTAMLSFNPGATNCAVLQTNGTPTDQQIANALSMFQIMIWDLGPPPSAAQVTLPSAGLDFGDPQVRAGLLSIFGDTANGNANAIGKAGCGQQVGRRIELVLAAAPIGATTAFTAAHPIQRDAKGVTIYGQTVTGDDVVSAMTKG